MVKKVVNPETGRKVNLGGRVGQRILSQYGGGPPFGWGASNVKTAGRDVMVHARDARDQIRGAVGHGFGRAQQAATRAAMTVAADMCAIDGEGNLLPVITCGKAGGMSLEARRGRYTAMNQPPASGGGKRARNNNRRNSNRRKSNRRKSNRRRSNRKRN